MLDWGFILQREISTQPLLSAQGGGRNKPLQIDKNLPTITSTFCFWQFSFVMCSTSRSMRSPNSLGWRNTGKISLLQPDESTIINCQSFSGKFSTHSVLRLVKLRGETLSDSFVRSYSFQVIKLVMFSCIQPYLPPPSIVPLFMLPWCHQCTEPADVDHSSVKATFAPPSGRFGKGFTGKQTIVTAQKPRYSQKANLGGQLRPFLWGVGEKGFLDTKWKVARKTFRRLWHHPRNIFHPGNVCCSLNWPHLWAGKPLSPIPHIQGVSSKSRLEISAASWHGDAAISFCWLRHHYRAKT